MSDGGVRAAWFVTVLGALVPVLAGCGASLDNESSGEEQDALAASEKANVGLAEAYPDVALYEGPTTAKSTIFHEFVQILHAGVTRIIVTASTAGNAADMATALQWARDARSLGLDPYVTITAPVGYDVHEYAKNIATVYRALAGHAVHFAAINEPDLNGFSAEDAADYWAYGSLGLRSVCGKKCFVAAGEFAQVNASSEYVKHYMERIIKHLHNNRELRKPLFWSMHDYADMNEGSHAHAEDYANLLTDSEFSGARIWITELGTEFKHNYTGGSCQTVADCNGSDVLPLTCTSNRCKEIEETHIAGNRDAQEKAGRIFLDMARAVPGVTRTIYYEVEALSDPMNAWDSALLDWNGAARPIVCELLDEPRAECPGELRGAGF